MAEISVSRSRPLTEVGRTTIVTISRARLSYSIPQDYQSASVFSKLYCLWVGALLSLRQSLKGQFHTCLSQYGYKYIPYTVEPRGILRQVLSLTYTSLYGDTVVFLAFLNRIDDLAFQLYLRLLLPSFILDIQRLANPLPFSLSKRSSPRWKPPLSRARSTLVFFPLQCFYHPRHTHCKYIRRPQEI